MTTSYCSIYTKLARNEFRLIELRPLGPCLSTSGQNEAKLVECLLKTVPFTGAMTYNALSYTWGDASNLRPIKINGCVVQVTASLEEALRYLQVELKPLTVWADALCINQMDEQEKGEMVQQMKNIYQNADSVIVWLGPPADGSDMLMDLLNEIGEEVLQTGIMSVTMAERMSWFNNGTEKRRDPRMGTIEKMIEKVDSSLPFHEYKMLLQRPWWSRIWVVQEICVGRQVTLACGSRRIPFDKFSALVFFQEVLRVSVHHRLISQVSPSPEVSTALQALIETEPFSNARFMIGARRDYQKHLRQTRVLSLLTLLIEANTSSRGSIELGATDPRDRVFALVGLAEDAKSLGIYPDYTKGDREVYIEIARKLLEHGQLEVLALAQFPKYDVDLPSWVPDWRGDMRLRDEAHKDRSLFCTGYAQSSGVRCKSLPNGTEVLALDASFVDTVSKVELPFKLDADGQLDWDLVGTFLSEIKSLCEESDSLRENIYKIARQREEACWRVSITDMEICGSSGHERATRSSLEGYNTACERINLVRARSQSISQGSEAAMERPKSDNSSLGRHIWNLFLSVDRCPFITSKGYVGLGPNHLQPGDEIYIIFGAPVPFVVRKGDEDRYRLVGDVYVHGIMDGEFTEGKFEVEDLQIY